MPDNFPYTVLMREIATGEERISGPYNFKFGHFWWTEGNFGCGCNRQAEWHRAHPDYEKQGWDEIDEDYIHPELGSLFGECEPRKYEVLYATLADGTIVNIDREDEPSEELGESFFKKTDE